MSLGRGTAAGLVGAVASAAPALAAEGGGGGASLIQPEIGTIFWTTITFLLMLFALRRWAWKPLLGALEQREKSIQSNIDQARAERDQAQALLAEQRSLVDQARRERGEALQKGQQDAERLRAEILEEARKQRELLLQQTQAQVQSEVRQARTELRALAADLAIGAAEKLISKQLDEATHRRLVEEYLRDLERSRDPGSAPPS